jgi:hypothetical protein
MQKFLLVFLIGCISLTGNAQKRDKVYLKNGSVLRGKIVLKSDSGVRIIVIGGNVWSIPSVYIAGIGKARPENQKVNSADNEKTINNERLINKHKGYNLITNIGLNFPVSGEKHSYFRCNMINSYSFWPNFSIGLGIGFDRDVRAYFPVFADARYYLNRKHFAPFISVSYGKAIVEDKSVYYFWRDLKNNGGPYFCTSVGIELPMNNKLSFLFALEYKYQRNTFKSLPNTTYYELIEENNRIGIQLGFLFN